MLTLSDVLLRGKWILVVGSKGGGSVVRLRPQGGFEWRGSAIIHLLIYCYMPVIWSLKCSLVITLINCSMLTH